VRSACSGGETARWCESCTGAAVAACFSRPNQFNCSRSPSLPREERERAQSCANTTIIPKAQELLSKSASSACVVVLAPLAVHVIARYSSQAVSLGPRLCRSRCCSCYSHALMVSLCLPLRFPHATRRRRRRAASSSITPH